jgi:hypothetical protein
MFERVSDKLRESNLVLSPSSISVFLKSPPQYHREFVLGLKPEQTSAMFEGEVIHKAILEPDRFEKEFLVPEPRETFLTTIEQLKAEIMRFGEKPVKGSKADLINQLLALNPSARIWDVYLDEINASERRVISQTLWETCREIQNSVKRHLWLSKALDGGESEVPCYFEFSEGVILSMRMDFYNTKHKQPIVLDVKTTRCAEYESFQRDVWNHNLYVQAAIYVDAVQKITGVTPLFAWVAVEKQAPYAVEVYAADFGLLEAGRAVYHKTIPKIIERYHSQDWSYNKNKIVNLTLPAWGFSKLDHYAEGELYE